MVWNKGKKMSKEFCKKNSESHLGQIPWNKGLTKKTDKRVKDNSKFVSDYNKKNLLGKTYEQIHGNVKAKKIKKLISENCRTKPITEESRKNYRKAAILREQKFKESGKKKEMANTHSKFMKKYSNLPENIERSRVSGAESLRKIALKRENRIEKRMRMKLKEIGVTFNQEKIVYVKGKVRYRVDFELPKQKIIIECDGAQWHKDKESDEKRENLILSQPEYEDYLFLRFTGKDINNDLYGVGLFVQNCCNRESYTI